MTLIAKAAVEKTAISFDRLFDYLIPPELEGKVKVGCRVSVPFGAGNKYRQGMILDIIQAESSDGLKSVSEMLDETPILSEEMVGLVFWLREMAFCTYYDVVRAILPSGFSYRLEKSYSIVTNLDSLSKDDFSDSQLELISLLRKSENQNGINSIITHYCNLRRGDVDKLIALGIIDQFTSSKRNIGDKTINMIRLEKQDYQNAKLSSKQRTVADFLADVGTASIKETCYFCGVTDIVIKNLQKQNIIEIYLQETYRNPYKDHIIEDDSDFSLTENQNEILGGLQAQYKNESPSAALLHGVTGSGKTHIFIHLIKGIIKNGKQAIVLVPEISLTPQLVAKFRGSFGDIVAVMHSNLSMGEQLDEYKRIQAGHAKIVIGTRSAVFVPFENIGLIIIDEEGESSYKSSDMAPRYHAADVAKYRCVKHNAMLLLASATPSIKSYYLAQKGVYTLYELNERYSNAVLPEVALIDMRREPPSLVSGISESLAEEIYQNLERREQVILLLNRRGYNSVQNCVDCGWTAECPNCSVGMTFHKANGFLMCHYCGYSSPPFKTCEQCGGNHIIMTGQGTQKIEDDLHTLFPNARILRMDADTIFNRTALEEKIAAFSEGNYDILIGTQIVAKGLNFPNVTLVGVLSADSLMYGNDYKCQEQAFSMLTQVVGRSGRGDKVGRALIQTYHPDHPVILSAATQNYKSFYHDEIIERKALVYPPFCDLFLIQVSGKKEQEVEQGIHYLIQTLNYAARKPDKEVKMKILGRSKPYIYRMNNKYRQRVIIKCKNNSPFRKLMRKIIVFAASRKQFSNLQIYGDMNGEIN